MANRHTLAIHKLDEFKQWLDLVGIEHRPTTADWQVLQVRLPNDPRWHAVYQKLSAKEHLSVPEPLARLVRAFVSGSDPYEALAADQRHLGKVITFGLRYGSPTGRMVQPHQPLPQQLPIQTQAAQQLLTAVSTDDTPPWE